MSCGVCFACFSALPTVGGAAGCTRALKEEHAFGRIHERKGPTMRSEKKRDRCEKLLSDDFNACIEAWNSGGPDKPPSKTRMSESAIRRRMQWQFPSA